MLLDIKNIDVLYDDFQVIWDVSINVDKAEMVALLGPNGSGKSTILNTISNLVEHRNGTINFETDKFNTWSFNFTAQSGRPYTVANGVFEINDKSVPIFLERNNARLPFYHRLDFSWKVAYNKDDYDRWRGDWTLTIYNLYGAKNPLNRYYTEKNGSQFGNFFW